MTSFGMSYRFNPRTTARALQILITVVKPPLVMDVRMIPKAVEEWTLRRSILREEFHEILSGSMASANLATMLPSDFQNLVFEHWAGGEVPYEAVKDKVRSESVSRIAQASPVQMDIGETAVSGLNHEEWGRRA